MKACQVSPGAKFGKKHMVAAEVNDKAIKKIELIFLREYVSACKKIRKSEQPELSKILTGDITIGKLTV